MRPVAISDAFFFFSAIALGLFFALANWATKRRRSRSTPQDVAASIETLFESGSMDEWELFIHWPVDDPSLESIRLRCAAIDEEHYRGSGQYMTAEGIRLAAEILNELKSHIERQRTTFNA